MIDLKSTAAFLAATTLAFAGAYTPDPGSPERKAICDGVREYVFARLATKKPAKKVLFKIHHLRVDQGIAWFEGTPVFEDGSYVPPDYIPDMDYVMIVQKTKAGWKVTENLSRSDVPGGDEIAQINKRLKNVPSSIIPKFWRETLHR